jgi:hypothetical protein
MIWRCILPSDGEVLLENQRIGKVQEAEHPGNISAQIVADQYFRVDIRIVRQSIAYHLMLTVLAETMFWNLKLDVVEYESEGDEGFGWTVTLLLNLTAGVIRSPAVSRQDFPSVN